MNETTFDLTRARKTFSRIGWAMCAILVIAPAIQLLCIRIPEMLWGESNWLLTSSWGKWLLSFLPLYLVAIPVGLLIMKKLPAERPQEGKLKLWELLSYFAIGFCVMYAGNIIGTVLSLILSGGNAQNDVLEIAMDTNPLKLLFVVILAPLLEEYVCRRQIIDRTRQYGEKTAIFLSALIFGLLHQNLFQFFYAFGLGLIFGYIYVRTGRLRYTVLMHSVINFMGGVIAPWIITLLDMDTLAKLDPYAPMEELMALYQKILPGLVVYLGYILFLFLVSLTGLVLLIIKCCNLTWKPGALQLPRGTAAKTVYLNAGMVVYVVLCIVSFVLALM